MTCESVTVGSNTSPLSGPIDGFVRMSHYLGGNPAYVQGGGGNTSAKLDTTRMAVKASGISLQDTSERIGYANIDYRDVRKYLLAPHEDEDAFNARVISSRSDPAVRPSMETGFHAVLDGYVLHSHSVYANVINCAQNGRKLLQELDAEAVWIDYVAPGRELTLKVLERTQGKVFFLANHGLIVRGEDADEVIAAHESLNQRIRVYLGLPAFERDGIELVSRAFMDDHILFPDQVIYTNPASKFEGSKAQRETLAAYSYIHGWIDQLPDLAPHYLRPEDARFLLNMNAEKHRSKVGD